MTNGQIFRAAAQYIREHGWHQGSFGNDGGPRCTAGAIGSTVGWEGESVISLIATRVGACVAGCDLSSCRDHEFNCVGDWNDRPERTKEEVIAMFEGLAFDEDLKAAATAVDTTIPVAVQITQSSQAVILPTLKEAVPA